MSFKENILSHCNHVSCMNCPFQKPCDKVDDDAMPSTWSDRKFDLLRQYLEEHHTKLTCELAEIENILIE